MDTRTKSLMSAQSIAEEHGTRLVADTSESGMVARHPLAVATAASMKRAIEALGLEVSDAPDGEDSSLRWVYVR